MSLFSFHVKQSHSWAGTVSDLFQKSNKKKKKNYLLHENGSNSYFGLRNLAKQGLSVHRLPANWNS